MSIAARADSMSTVRAWTSASTGASVRACSAGLLGVPDPRLTRQDCWLGLGEFGLTAERQGQAPGELDSSDKGSVPLCHCLIGFRGDLSCYLSLRTTERQNIVEVIETRTSLEVARRAEGVDVEILADRARLFQRDKCVAYLLVGLADAGIGTATTCGEFIFDPLVLICGEQALQDFAPFVGTRSQKGRELALG